MSQSFAFPASPTLNQIVVLPDGNSAQWNGYAWVSVANNVTYPLSIPNGGTGATAPSTARTNLGINTATGEFVITKDGTAAAPGMQWLSEPGLGWYRRGASQISVAAQGSQVSGIDASGAALTTMGLWPRSAGQTAFYLSNAPSGAANSNALGLSVLPNGDSQMSNTGVGTGPTGTSLQYVNFANLVLTSPAGAQLLLRKAASAQSSAVVGGLGTNAHWIMALGDTNPMSGSNSGSDFGIYRYSDAGAFLGTSMSINRANGVAAFFTTNQTVTLYLRDDGTQGVNLKFMNGGLSKTIRLAPNNNLEFINGAYSNAVMTLSDTGQLGVTQSITVQQGNVTLLAGSQGAAADGGIYGTRAYNDPNKVVNYYCTQGGYGVCGIISVNDSTIHRYFQFSENANAYTDGSWVPGSDGRVKVNRVVIDQATAKVQALTGYVYTRTDLTNFDGSAVRAAGVIAQDVEVVLPEAVSQGESLSTGIKDFRHLDYNAVTALLVNAVKEINTRLAALEK